MTENKYPEAPFYERIENLTIAELEALLKGLSKEVDVNRKKINDCVNQRKYMLKNMFKYTNENVERLNHLVNLIKDNVEMLHKKGEDDMINNDDTKTIFFERTEKLTVFELECLIRGLSKEMQVNREKINDCLERRKHLLTEMFKCTPQNVERLHCVANLIKDNVAMLYKKGNELYEETCKLWQEGKNKPFTNFRVEISITACFNDEETSIFLLDDDNTGADYVRMAELLDDFYQTKYNCSNLIVDHSRYYKEEREKEVFNFIDQYDKTDDWGEPWFFKRFPELQGLPIIKEFHELLFHSRYALQDIIRINDIWSTAKVIWQHTERQNKES